MEGGNAGSDDVRAAISGCRKQVLGYGQTFVHKPGMQSGPVEQGIEELIAKDPNAYWDGNKVVSEYGKSPRVRAIPLFDPYYYDDGKHTGKNASLKFVNYLGIFVEGMKGSEVIARIVPIAGMKDGGLPEAPAAAFPKAIVLVK